MKKNLSPACDFQISLIDLVWLYSAEMDQSLLLVTVVFALV